MAYRRLIREVGVPVFGFFAFFAVQSFGRLDEWLLTALICLVLVVMFRIRYHPREYILFGLGVLLGCCIEIGLRRFGYQQVWNDASLAGVPIWLPLAWGFGTVVFTRIGYAVRHLR